MVCHTLTNSNDKGNLLLMIGNITTDQVLLNKGTKLAKVRQMMKTLQILKI